MDPIDTLPTNPQSPTVTRRIRVGGVKKETLLAECLATGHQLNGAARVLFADHRFETSDVNYLRRIDGVLWLRGYYSGPAHLWSPEDILVFCRIASAAWQQATQRATNLKP